MRFFLIFIAILAVFTLVGCDSEEPLNARLEALKNTTNLTETTVVLEGDSTLHTNYFKRDQDNISFDFTHTNGDHISIVVTVVDDERKWYETSEYDDCWHLRDLDESAFRYFSTQHSNVRMLPSSIELDWFETNEDGTVFTLKSDFFDDLRARTNMSSDEYFDAYQLTLEDDALTLDVDVTVVSDSVSSLRYSITFESIDTTDVEVPEFDLCPTPTS